MESNKNRGSISLPLFQTPNNREALIRNFTRSGLSRSEFCRRHGVSYWTFNSWLRKKEKKPGIGFLETEIPLSPSRPVEIDLPNGCRVRFFIEGARQIQILRDFLT